MKSAAVAAAVAVLLFAIGGALAASPSTWKIARTAAGNTAAMSETLRKSDLGAGWTGGAKKPDLTSTMPCSNYRPKQSDLTVVGAARAVWGSNGLEVDDSATLLRTARMVKLDWKRTVTAAQVLPCVRRGFRKHAAGEKLISLAWVRGFPHLGRMSRAYRVVADYKGSLGDTVRIESDIAAIGGGRSELSVIVGGPASKAHAIRKTELRLARLIAARLER